VSLYDLFTSGESYSRAFVLVLTVKSLKYSEDAICILHIETDPVISNGNYPEPPLGLSGQVDFGPSIAAILNGILNKVLEDAKQAVICTDRWQLVARYNRFAFSNLAKVHNSPAEGVVTVDRFLGRWVFDRQSTIIQEIID
jgi:hypothetical protein